MDRDDLGRSEDDMPVAAANSSSDSFDESLSSADAKQESRYGQVEPETAIMEKAYSRTTKKA